MRKSLPTLILAAVALVLAARAPGAAAPAPTAKLYELRIYAANAGRVVDLQALFRTDGARLLAKHGIESVFTGTVLEGAATDGKEAPNLLVGVFSHAGDRAAAEHAWAALEAEADWKAGPLLAKPPLSTFMQATDFSPGLTTAASGSTATQHVFELRKYNTGAAGLPYTLHRFKVGMAAILVQAGMSPLAYWTAVDSSAFIYLVAHRDREAARAAWSAFLPDYRAFMAEYPTRPDAVAATPRTPEENRFLVPTDFSPLR